MARVDHAFDGALRAIGRRTTRRREPSTTINESEPDSPNHMVPALTMP
jgi:hypothetical protein